MQWNVMRKRAVIVVALFVAGFGGTTKRQAVQFGSVPVASTAAVPQSVYLSPDQLMEAIQKGGKDAPLVIQVGSKMMFEQGHIPGSVFAGPAVQPEGIELLRNRVSSLARTRAIVIYCGCCPWGRCPNMGTAYQFLNGMGFKNVKALYLPTNFGTDWVAKGYKVEK